MHNSTILTITALSFSAIVHAQSVDTPIITVHAEAPPTYASPFDKNDIKLAGTSRKTERPESMIESPIKLELVRPELESSAPNQLISTKLSRHNTRLVGTLNVKKLPGHQPLQETAKNQEIPKTLDVKAKNTKIDMPSLNQDSELNVTKAVTLDARHSISPPELSAAMPISSKFPDSPAIPDNKFVEKINAPLSLKMESTNKETPSAIVKNYSPTTSMYYAKGGECDILFSTACINQEQKKIGTTAIWYFLALISAIAVGIMRKPAERWWAHRDPATRDQWFSK
jgi:hypothetical protein